MAIIVQPGTWALSRPTQVEGTWTTFASVQRLGSGVQNFFPPFSNGLPLENAVLVRLTGVIVNPVDANTVIFPLPITNVSDPTIGDLTAGQRLALRNNVNSWLQDYTYTDYDGTVVSKSNFTLKSVGWTNATKLSEVVQDIYGWIGHTQSRPRVARRETHNTEYLDSFATDPTARWTRLQDTFLTWLSGSAEINVDGDNGLFHAYTANNPGSMEQEAQLTGVIATGQRIPGPGTRIYSNGVGSSDGYGMTLDFVGNLQLWRYNAGVQTNIALQNVTSAPATTDYYTQRLAASGGNGANVVLDTWFLQHGGSKPSDPGWIGNNASPDYTYTDTSVDRLDDVALHIYAGIVGRGSSAFPSLSANTWFKERAISDRVSYGPVLPVGTSYRFTKIPRRGYP